MVPQSAGGSVAEATQHSIQPPFADAQEISADSCVTLTGISSSINRTHSTPLAARHTTVNETSLDACHSAW